MYFISRNNKKEGPLSLEDVKKLKITEDILVWREGLTNWVNIKEIPELKDFIIGTPPPLPVEIENEENKSFQKFRFNKSKKIIIRNILIGVVIGILFAINHYYQATHSAGEELDNKYPIYLTTEERENPYLIFWHMLPYTLLVGQIIMSLVSGFQIYNIKLSNFKRNDVTDNSEPTQPKESDENWFLPTVIVLILISIVIIAVVYQNSPKLLNNNIVEPQSEMATEEVTPELLIDSTSIVTDSAPFSVNSSLPLSEDSIISNSNTIEQEDINYFSIGSKESDVLKIMGTPTSVINIKSLNKKIFYYGISSVTFSYGTVEEYSNFGKNLKVRY